MSTSQPTTEHTRRSRPSHDAQPRPRLALQAEGGPCVALPERGRVVVGSLRGVDVRIVDPYVSGRHAEIRIDPLGARIEDLDSTNGTWVDGIRVRCAWLELGSSVRIGRHRLAVIAADGPDPASASEPEPRGADLRTGPRMVGRSASFRRLLIASRKLASLRPPVLVIGETGTGKELIARALHETGDRQARRFVAVNCAAIPDQLAESQLFGHVRGAFTGADRAHTGAFVRAHGGTLFLDEIAELPLALQAKLLRVLETGCVTPVGSEHEIPVDVRVVSATHRSLERMVRAGSLREDLFHRLSVFVLRVPPLRERPEDIPPLLDHFLAEAGRELGREVAISRDAVEAARKHPWPGNVRALRNAVLRAAALSDGPIGPEALLGPSPSGESPAADEPASGPFARAAARDAISIPRGDYASMQHSMLRQVVAEAGSIRRAARLLGVPRSTLGTWLRRGS